MVGVAALLLGLGQSVQQAAGDLEAAVRNLESVGVVRTAFCPFFFFFPLKAALFGGLGKWKFF